MLCSQHNFHATLLKMLKIDIGGGAGNIYTCLWYIPSATTLYVFDDNQYLLWLYVMVNATKKGKL